MNDQFGCPSPSVDCCERLIELKARVVSEESVLMIVCVISDLLLLGYIDAKVTYPCMCRTEMGRCVFVIVFPSLVFASLSLLILPFS
jgi:hypothetical protein